MEDRWDDDFVVIYHALLSVNYTVSNFLAMSAYHDTVSVSIHLLILYNKYGSSLSHLYDTDKINDFQFSWSRTSIIN